MFEGCSSGPSSSHTTLARNRHQVPRFCSILCNFGSSAAHRNSNVCLLQHQNIVHAVTSHGHKLARSPCVWLACNGCNTCAATRGVSGGLLLGASLDNTELAILVDLDRADAEQAAEADRSLSRVGPLRPRRFKPHVGNSPQLLPSVASAASMLHASLEPVATAADPATCCCFSVGAGVAWVSACRG